MEEREIIQNKLKSMQKLESFSDEELLALSETDFSVVMKGLAICMNSTFVCYAYKYNDIVRKMINKNRRVVEENDELNQSVYKILSHLNEYDSRGLTFRREFSPQYESVTMSYLGLDKLQMSLHDFYIHAPGVLDNIENVELEEIRSNKYFLAMVSYLATFHPEYLIDSHMIFSIQNTLSNINKNDFNSVEEYRSFKKVANKTMTKLQKYSKNREKKYLKEKKNNL